ncbi:MAG: hypothetical protein AAGB29_02875 [Planctomycetota bacterium]
MNVAPLRQLAQARPANDDQLDRFVRVVLGLRIARTPVAPGSSAPFDYLRHAFFTGTDCVVWANRGGGKTLLGAVATLLDLIFTPGIQVRLLGGSLEQSAKMHEHLVRLLERPAFRRGVLAQPPTRRRIALANGSAVELLAQSPRSVRGTRVHKLRCDEVDEFKQDVWAAAQFVTRSDTLGGSTIPGAIESFSTMHRPFGLMSRVVADASETSIPVFRWGALDVAAACPPQRPCDRCEIQQDCQGLAKQADGFVPIDDLITQRRRASDETWQAELLCHRPRHSDCVYPMFDPDTHVQSAPPGERTWFAGMDFGVRDPTTFLWASTPITDDASPRPGPDTPLHIHAEHRATDLTLDANLDRIAARDLPAPRWIAIDPAGLARNEQTGISNARRLRERGLTPRAQRHGVLAGIERVRRRLDRGLLTIDPACPQLARALAEYHFDPDRPHQQTPVKDGPDHLADALRYLINTLDTHHPATCSSYL